MKDDVAFRRHRRHVAFRDGSGLVADIAARLGERRGTLSANLVNFARALRAAGFDVTAGRVIDAARSLAAMDLGSLEDMRLALRANFLTEHAQTVLFDTLFDLYWRDPSAPPPDIPVATQQEREQAQRQEAAGDRRLVAAAPRPAFQANGDNPEQTAGDADLLTVKDFSTYSDEDLAQARRVIRAIAPKLASAAARRRRLSHRGDEIDLRRSLRHAARHGGEVLRLLRRRRRVRRLRLVLLCDVSGSMDLYSRQLVQFLFAVQNELRGVSTYVFSTRLHDITHLLKTRSFDEALARIGRDVDAWSGGTSIGRCLAEFERGHARRRVDSRTVLVIISDGWDRGDIEQLRQAMAGLKRRARRIVWLNPLLGHAEYKPLARGMAAALPYTDEFLPAHNLDALARVARSLASVRT
jgi:uncharacterized protein with von Willebrand factor type A (vWA) domain